MLIFFFFLPALLNAQVLDSVLTGSWFEQYKKTHAHYVPLQIELKADKTARYINRYPEQSYRLSYNIINDSLLLLSNGEAYRIVFIDEKLMKLKKQNKNSVMVLEKSVRLYR